MNAVAENGCNYSVWIQYDSWSLREGILLVLGFNPRASSVVGHEFRGNENAKERYNHIFDLAVKAVPLGLIDYKANNPSSFLHWVESKGFDVPVALKQALLEQKQKLAQASIDGNEYLYTISHYAQKASSEYLEWRNKNPLKKNMMSRVVEPILQTITTDTREIEILKRVLKRQFSELS